MKLLTIIKKNFKTLLRTKGSAFVTIFGPLLVILLVGLAFTSTSKSDFSIGTFAKDDSVLSVEYINNLKESNFIVTEYQSEQDCIDKIQEGKIHMCIVFPEDFEIRNDKTNEIVFHVDNSRQNMVYQVMNAIDTNLENTSISLSKDITQTIIETLFFIKDENKRDISKIINYKKDIDDIRAGMDTTKGQLDSIDLTSDEVGTEDITNKVDVLETNAQRLKDIGMGVVNQALEFADLVSSNTSISTTEFENQIEDLELSLKDEFNQTPYKIAQLKDAVTRTEQDLGKIEQKLNLAKAKRNDVKNRLDSLKDDLNSLKNGLGILQQSFETIDSRIDQLTITDAENIIKPITTKINPVASENTKLSVLFPGLVMLLLMFLAVLLSGSFVVMEKNSRSFFRTFTTSIKEYYFVFSTYLTSLTIIIGQIIIILLIASFFIKGQAVHNLPLSLLILFLAATFFIMLGMGIGYLFSSQEAVTMISISIGSLFLLLSDTIIPIDTISPNAQAIAQYNPYVIATDLFRKTMLFDISIFESTIWLNLVWLIVYSVVAFGIILAVNRISTTKFFERKHLHHHGPTMMKEDKNLVLGQIVISDKFELLDALKKMDNNEFSKHCYEHKNEFSIWTKECLGDEKLSRMMKNKTRYEMIALLEQDLNKNKEKKVQLGTKTENMYEEQGK
ncbi:ABC transporter permease [Candidatus Woesearchaeota archaeon]|nr:ABC transporter permease [Candidatus Woesearchaeota archaeon]